MMDLFPSPSRQTTPSEYAVLIHGASIILILLGLAGFGIRIFATPEDEAVSEFLSYCSAWALGTGAFITFIHWLVRRLSG